MEHSFPCKVKVDRRGRKEENKRRLWTFKIGYFEKLKFSFTGLLLVHLSSFAKLVTQIFTAIV